MRFLQLIWLLFLLCLCYRISRAGLCSAYIHSVGRTKPSIWLSTSSAWLPTSSTWLPTSTTGLLSTYSINNSCSNSSRFQRTCSQLLGLVYHQLFILLLASWPHCNYYVSAIPKSTCGWWVIYIYKLSGGDYYYPPSTYCRKGSGRVQY